MKALDIIDSNSKKVGEVALSEAFFEKKVNKAVLYEAVKRALASKHHGTVRTKTRSEVNRTTKKIYRQKGTGNARHGSRKSAPYVGGGRVFGPKPRDYTLDMPKKVRKLAFSEALKNQINEGRFLIVNEFPFTGIKTKAAKSFFDQLGVKRGLVILESSSEAIEKSIRNLKDFKIAKAAHLSIIDILKYPKIVATAQAFKSISDNYLV